jgi:serine/threonine protein kinase
MMRDQVFVSYAHEDKAWFDQFDQHLRPAQSKGLLKVWSDCDIHTGADWLQAIRDNLGRSRVGLLLVTPSFIDSDFIRDQELCALLGARGEGNLSLYWVPVSASLVEIVNLNQLQAAPGCDPERPLNTLSVPEQQQTIVKICRSILDEMGRLPAMTQDDRRDLRDAVSARLGGRYELLEEIGTGSSSICYKARSQSLDRIVVVKTLVSSRLQPSTKDEFRQRIEIASKLTDPTYIQLHDAYLDREPYCVVTEFVDGGSLDHYLANAKALPFSRARDILLGLARALANAHAHDVLHEGLLPSNVHIDRANKARISAFRFLNIGPASGYWGTFLINHETCTYMSPEQFEGQVRSKASDQYALGLLGYELLSGLRLERVMRPRDFVGRPAFYASLEHEAAWTLRFKALGGIVSRMLRMDPEQRWRSMDEVVSMLENVTSTDSDDESPRSRVLASYSRLQSSDRARSFCKTFYTHLFCAVPDAEAMFARARIDMVRQYDAVNKAIKLLLDYDPASPASVNDIRAVAERHARLTLQPGHLDAFQAALIAALRESGETEPTTLDSWTRVVSPGMSFMRSALQSMAAGVPLAPSPPVVDAPAPTATAAR